MRALVPWLVVMIGLSACTAQPIARRTASAEAVVPQTSISAKLELESMIAVLEELFPGRNHEAVYGYRGLLEDFRHFGVTTVAAMRQIISIHWGFAQEQERARNALFGVPAHGYYYNSVGMARAALRKHVGEAAFDAYELQGRPKS